MEKLLFKSYSDLVTDIRQNIEVFSKRNFDLVVGIPRSGMIPAYLVSAYLNIDCCDVDSYINNSSLQKGITRKTRGGLLFPHDAKNVLLLDDSVFSGDSMCVIKERIPHLLLERITTGVIYATGNGKNKVDIFIKALEGKKIFEWGIYHNNLLGKTCFDMDGVLCKECTPDQNDDGHNYLNFIQNADPLFLPSRKIHSIITNRLEKYRAETEKWLHKHGVEYGQLYMLNFDSMAARDNFDAGIEHKGKIYKSLKDAELFIESSINQSKSIALVSGKPVYCADESIFIEPAFNSVVRNNLNGLLKTKYYAFKHSVKMVVLRLTSK